MIHYIFAAAFGALIGSQSKKSKKSYADGGLIVSWFDKDINYQSKRFDTKKMEDAKRFFYQKQSEYLKPTLTTYDNDVILDSTYAKGGIIWKKNIGFDGWSPTMESESAYENVGGYISENGNWLIHREGKFYERDWGDNFERRGYWLVYGKNEYGQVEDLKGHFETLSEAKKYVERWVEINPKDYAKGGKMFVPQGREILYQDENVALQHNKVSDHYSMINPETGRYMAKGGEVVPNYLKGKKTEVTKILLNGETEDSKLELMLYKDGDLDDINRAEYYTGDYIDLDRLNNQIHKLVKTHNLEEVYLKFPHDIYEFDQIILWTKDKMEKGGKTDDLGNPTEPKILEKMEIFIKNEIPKLDKGRFFTDGMQRKEAKKRFYQRFEYGAYNPKFSFDFAKGGEVKEWEKYVSENSSWFDYETRDSNNNEILLSTRENGSVGDEEAGQEDIDEAKNIVRKVIAKFPKTQYEIYEVDEWVNVTLMPNKTKEQLGKEKIERKQKKIKKETSKIIAKELNVTNEKALEIVEYHNFSYAKEYYEENKDSKPTYNNAFRVYFKYKGVSSIKFDSAKQVFDYISKDSFAEDVYYSSNPRQTVHISLYGFDSLIIDFDKDGRPIKPNGDRDWGSRGEVLSVSPFFEGNIENGKDFIQKLRKAISDFIITYKIYVLQDIEDFAKGGMTEHGLQLGDKIIGAGGNSINVVTKKGGQKKVDLSEGTRESFAKGGKTLPRPAKDFIAYVIDMDGNATLKYSKTFQGANRMMKNLMKKIQDVSTHGISKYDPFYGTRVGKMFFEPIKGFAKGGKMQGYNARGDEELGMTDGKESRFQQSKKDRRDEMKGENRSAGNKTYGSFEKGGKTNWIQEVVDSPDFRKGAFTKKAKERGLTPEKFMSKVLNNPNKYDERTRKQAQFMKNITD